MMKISYIFQGNPLRCIAKQQTQKYRSAKIKINIRQYNNATKW